MTTEITSVPPTTGRGAVRQCLVCEASFKPRGPQKVCGETCRQARKRSEKLAWDRKNPELVKKYKQAYRSNNMDKIAAYGRAYQLANREQALEAGRRWQKANPEKNALKSRVRRTRTKSSPGVGITQEDWLLILQLSEYRCSYCRDDLGDSVHLEHVIPVVRGGWHDPSNCVPSCPDCNLSKGKKTAAEWKPDWIPPFWITIREATK